MPERCLNVISTSVASIGTKWWLLTHNKVLPGEEERNEFAPEGLACYGVEEKVY